MTTETIPTHSISLLVANKPGVLVRIALVFSRRGYNIDSLVVSPTMDGKFARMNICASGDPTILQQILAQLNKIIDVLHAFDHTGRNTVEKELALIKVKANADNRTELLQILEHFKAQTVDLTQHSLIIQVTGNSDKLDAMSTLLEKFEVVEVIRTGKVIMARGQEET
jgi:acetolactate synthase I/III small subunit